MVTVASLKLTVDATDAVSGARQTVTAFDSVTNAAKSSASAIDIYGLTATRILTTQEAAASRAAATADKLRDFNRAAGASNEIVSTTQRVRLLGEEVRNLGSGLSSASSIGTLFGASLIDVAQASSRAEGGLAGVVGLLKSSPLLAAGVVITAISTAMALFGGNTREANGALEKQIRLQEALKRASLDLATQIQRDKDLNQVGFPVDDQEAQFARARRYVEVAGGLAGTRGSQSFGDLQALTGLSKQALIDLTPANGFAGNYQSSVSPGLQGSTSSYTVTGLTSEAAREVLLLLAQSIKSNADFLPSGLSGGSNRVRADPSLFPTVGIYGGLGASSPYGPSPAMPGVGYGSAIGPSPAGLSPFEQGRISNEIADAARASAEFEERLRALRDLGNDVGSALGNAFGSMVFNISNARQALAGFLQQLSAIGQQQITRGFGNAVANLFTPSAAQVATSNPLMNPGAIGPQLPPGA